jgi:hypothetical protein
MGAFAAQAGGTPIQDELAQPERREKSGGTEWEEIGRRYELHANYKLEMSRKRTEARILPVCAIAIAMKEARVRRNGRQNPRN